MASIEEPASNEPVPPPAAGGTMLRCPRFQRPRQSADMLSIIEGEQWIIRFGGASKDYYRDESGRARRIRRRPARYPEPDSYQLI